MGFIKIAAKLAKAIEADNRRKERERIRNYNAQVRNQNSLKKELDRALKESERIQKEVAKLELLHTKESSIQLAVLKTEESELTRVSFISLLTNSEEKTIYFDWEDLKNHDDFLVLKPKEPEYNKVPKEIDLREFEIKQTFKDKIFKKQFETKMIKAEDQKKSALLDYALHLEAVNKTNENLKNEYERALKEWLDNKSKFTEIQEQYNEKIDLLKDGYYENNIEAVEFYFDSIINSLDIPDQLLTSWTVNYDLETKILVIDYDLPDINIIPDLKTMKYISTRKEYTETKLKEKEISQIYDEILFQLSLRITNDVYLTDIDSNIDSIVFNGIYSGINKSTGLEETKCTMTMQTLKSEFTEINIKNVDARTCFLKFKGIASAKLSDLIPISPILQFNKNDDRFIEGKSVVDTIEGNNLASMDWQDFEYLIGELFEKEFAINGSEIKITQASRDGGVDAVMFDPDPIRGGKYIIQAKRYTNVVGVSAVRDLYGTLLNEGAVKGILVTTANYGPDSYQFAKDKPITLINGANLLHMLQKHGYEARIDIKEAKKLLYS